MKWLVFSRNRSYQLDAFLSTAKENAGIPPQQITVIYKYDEDHLQQLGSVMRDHEECNFIEEKDFRQQVIDWCKKSPGLISFATDDAIFTRMIDEEKIQNVLSSNPGVLTFSLRLGLHLERCYPLDCSQKIPDGQVVNEVFAWNSNAAEHDWNYPLSVDGHVFRSHEILQMLEFIPFKNPNSLEANLQLLRGKVSPIMCCFLKSHYMNIPINVVQNEYQNRCGQTHVDELRDAYGSGIRMKAELLRGFMNTSAHQEIQITP